MKSERNYGMNNIKPIPMGSIKRGDRKAVIIKTGDSSFTIQLFAHGERWANVYAQTHIGAGQQALDWVHPEGAE